jgi:hypothetical protein
VTKENSARTPRGSLAVEKRRWTSAGRRDLRLGIVAYTLDGLDITAPSFHVADACFPALFRSRDIEYYRLLYE